MTIIAMQTLGLLRNFFIDTFSLSYFVFRWAIILLWIAVT
jgi:hypothetical protein